MGREDEKKQVGQPLQWRGYRLYRYRYMVVGKNYDPLTDHYT